MIVVIEWFSCYTGYMYSIEFTQNDPFGGPKIVTPQGQHVSVTVLRDRGAKVTHRELVTADPMIGFIRRVHDNGVSMAYRYNGFLLLETDGYRPRELARLFSPEIQEWNKDGLIYVSDRRGNRIQVFRQNGEYLMERFVRPETGGSGSGFSLQFSRDPEQSLLYLMDGTNQRVWILRRKDLAILDRFGRPGRQAGEFIRAHMIAIDSKNRMYTGEAANGRRMQRWILKGTKPAASVKPPVQER